MSFQARVGRFVDVPANAFTDNTLTVEQKIPFSGKNLSRAREASAEAVAAYEQLRRAELDVRANVTAAYWRLSNAYAQLDLNRQNETLLNEAASLSRARYEAGTQTQADVLAATVERARLVEARADLEPRTRRRPEHAQRAAQPACPLAAGPAFAIRCKRCSAPEYALGRATGCAGPGVPARSPHRAEAHRRRAGPRRVFAPFVGAGPPPCVSTANSTTRLPKR